MIGGLAAQHWQLLVALGPNRTAVLSMVTYPLNIVVWLAGELQAACMRQPGEALQHTRVKLECKPEYMRTCCDAFHQAVHSGHVTDTALIFQGGIHRNCYAQ